MNTTSDNQAVMETAATSSDTAAWKYDLDTGIALRRIKGTKSKLTGWGNMEFDGKTIRISGWSHRRILSILIALVGLILMGLLEFREYAPAGSIQGWLWAVVAGLTGILLLLIGSDGGRLWFVSIFLNELFRARKDFTFSPDNLQAVVDSRTGFFALEVESGHWLTAQLDVQYSRKGFANRLKDLYGDRIRDKRILYFKRQMRGYFWMVILVCEYALVHACFSLLK